MDSNFATPYYHIEEEKLLGEINLLKDSLQKNWGERYVMGYSVKTNSLPWLLTYLRKQGFFAEIVSETEYLLSSSLGFSPAEMIYNGPIKSKDTFTLFLNQHAYLNIDSQDELSYLQELSARNPEKRYEIGIRVNYDVEADCPGETLMGKTGGRFGFCFENGELKKVIDTIASLPNIKISGLHMHSSSQLRTLHLFEALAKAACKVADTYQLRLDYIDMGGGYYGGVADKPNYSDYFPVICQALKASFDPAETTLLVEPGVSLLSSATTLVTTVKDIKDVRGIRYVVTDGSRLQLNPQVTRHTYPHHICLQGQTDREKIDSQWICGFTCMEYDRLFELQKEEELLVGDRIVYDLAGGYTMSLVPLFIRYFPAVYIHHMDGTYFTAREEWGIQEYLQKNYVE